MKKTLKFAVVACLAWAMPWAPAAAQYPDKPVTLVVPFGAGGTSDVVARLVGKALGEQLKQQVVAENRPGAGGNIAAASVARAAPDGYTLLSAFPGLTTNESLYRQLNYSPSKDFVPISLLASAPSVIVVNAELPVKTLDELIEYVRARPNAVNYGSAGMGSSSHLAGVAFNDRVKVDMTHVPYKGGAPALADLAGGRLDLAVFPLPEAMPLIQSGKVRPIALASSQRSDLRPDLPTVAEAGLDGFEVGSWYGLMAPAGTPPDVVKTLSEATQRALKSPEVVDAFGKQGLQMIASTPEQFAEFLSTERARWKAIIEKNNIRLD